MNNSIAASRTEYQRRLSDFTQILERELKSLTDQSTTAAENHHWWPSSISKYWVSGKDQKISKTGATGISRREYPRNIGCIKHHNTKSDGSKQMEIILSRIADSKNNWLMRKLISLRKNFKALSASTEAIQISSQAFDDRDRQNLARYTGAMLIRNPYRIGNLGSVEHQFSSLGRTGYAMAAGRLAGALDQGIKYYESSTANLLEIKDQMIELNQKLLLSYIIDFYGSDIDFIYTDSKEGFLISDCGIMGHHDGDLSHTYVPILPDIYIHYTNRRNSDLDGPINGFYYPESQRKNLNELMISYGTEHIFTSCPPSKELKQTIITLIGEEAPRPPVLEGNLIHFNQRGYRER